MSACLFVGLGFGSDARILVRQIYVVLDYRGILCGFVDRFLDRAPNAQEALATGLSEFKRNQEEFEVKYNFRFQEPDPEFIKRYPRTMADTIKKKDTSRKKKREDAKARKEEERAKQVWSLTLFFLPFYD